jgi:TatA/E family protein of Tat protein translocase
MNLGVMEILLIVAAIMLLFGAGQLPKLAKSLGSFISDFNNAKEEA